MRIVIVIRLLLYLALFVYFFIFRLFKSILFFVNWMRSHGTVSVLFPYLIKYYQIMFIIIIFWLGCDRVLGLLYFVPALLLSILTLLFLPSSSVFLSYFILAVPMRECLRKHSCMSSLFPYLYISCIMSCGNKIVAIFQHSRARICMKGFHGSFSPMLPSRCIKVGGETDSAIW